MSRFLQLAASEIACLTTLWYQMETSCKLRTFWLSGFVEVTSS